VIAKHNQDRALRWPPTHALNDAVRVIVPDRSRTPAVTEQKEVLDFAEVPCEELADAPDPRRHRRRSRIQSPRDLTMTAGSSCCTMPRAHPEAGAIAALRAQAQVVAPPARRNCDAVLDAPRGG
jgi:hypothetical protein